MQSFWSITLIVSLTLLVIVLIRRMQYLRWLGYAVINILIGAVILYLINMSGIFADFYIPINFATVLTVGVLGIPGVLLLVALRLTLI